MSPFQPKGSRALRVIIAELAAGRAAGELITYDELAPAIGVKDDEAGRSQIRQAVSAARPVLLRDHRRALVAVRGRGYRVAMPGEFAGIAQSHRRSSDRQIGRALAVIENAPESEMSPAELERHRAVGVVIRNLHARQMASEQRLADLEAAVFGPRPAGAIEGKVESPHS